jgi:four helix bundle protein
MTPEQLKARTKQFALDIIGLVNKLPRTLVAEIIGRQLVRCSTSVGANYRAACRGRSRAEFAAKIAIVLEEADETHYWLEMLHASGVFAGDSVHSLMREANELVAIFAASCKTARGERRKAMRDHA